VLGLRRRWDERRWVALDRALAGPELLVERAHLVQDPGIAWVSDQVLLLPPRAGDVVELLAAVPVPHVAVPTPVGALPAPLVGAGRRDRVALDRERSRCRV